MDPDRLLEEKAGIDFREVVDGYVVYDPATDRLHFLNPTAAFILKSCDGKTSVGEITSLFTEIFALEFAPVEDIETVIETMVTEGLLKPLN